MKDVKYTSIIKVNDSSNELLKDIIETINGYLRKNKGAAADFHLIKNIVDRHIDTVDEEINHMLPVPLYLGLAATMVGIIFGLLSLNGNVATENFVNSIGGLIDSIKYAMCCSLVGLLMTTFLSAWRYRKAKAKMERQVNELLNFIQMELLPHLNEDAVATLLNMQANLQKFNTDFEHNIAGFSGIMDEIHTAFDSQVQLVEKMNKMDMVQMAKFNQNVLIQLNSSMSEFEKFTQYLNKMNSFVSAATSLTNSINQQLDRTNSVELITNSIQTNIGNNERILASLQAFLEKVDADKAILKAANSLDSAVAEAMDSMRNHVNAQVESLQQYTSRAADDLEQLMTKERGHLDKLRNLEKMDNLVRSIENMSSENKVLIEALAKRIASLTSSIDSLGKGDHSRTGGLPTFVIWIVAVLLCVASGTFVYKELFSSRSKTVPDKKDSTNLVFPVDADVRQPTIDTIINIPQDKMLPVKNNKRMK